MSSTGNYLPFNPIKGQAFRLPLFETIINQPIWEIISSITGAFLDTRKDGNDAKQLFFKPDGTELYILSSSTYGDKILRIYQYTLSTPFDLTSGVLTKYVASTFLVNGLFFRPDGLKVFTGVGVSVAEFDLSVAWDISTMVFNQSFSVQAQTNGVLMLTFNGDGTKMYVSGNNVRTNINEYNLSVAYDISTATFFQAKDLVGNGLTNPVDSQFNSTGTELTIVDQDSGGELNKYTLSTPYDILTATFSNVIDTSVHTDRPNGIFITSDGLRTFLSTLDTSVIVELGTTGTQNITRHLLRSGISKNNGLFVPTTNPPTQIHTNDGSNLLIRTQPLQGYLDLTASEMNADVIYVIVSPEGSSLGGGQINGYENTTVIYTNPSVAGGSPFATPPVQPSTGQDISTTVMTFIVSAGEQGYFISNQAKGESGFNYYGLENTATKWYIIIKEPVGSGNIGYIMRRENRSPFAVSFANRASLNYRTQPPVL